LIIQHQQLKPASQLKEGRHAMKKIKEVVLSRNIDVSNRDRIRQELTIALCDQPNILLLDMQEVTAIDSCGLGVLIIILHQIRSWGGKVAICAPSDMVKMLLQLTNTDRIFPIYNSYAEFIQAHEQVVSDYDDVVDNNDSLERLKRLNRSDRPRPNSRLKELLHDGA
jgi:anti-anti-sigma factor